MCNECVVEAYLVRTIYLIIASAAQPASPSPPSSQGLSRIHVPAKLAGYTAVINLLQKRALNFEKKLFYFFEKYTWYKLILAAANEFRGYVNKELPNQETDIFYVTGNEF